jgi:ribosomal protein S18 acetylase RimI-like enzyme
MTNFFITLPRNELAGQIAKLLNENNKLTVHHTANTILTSRANYFVDVVNGIVIGCVALQKENALFTRQFHMCVHPNFRRLGIAKRLSQAAVNSADTQYVYTTIREDNAASLNLNKNLGFTIIGGVWVNDHNVLTLVKKVGK